MMRCLLSLLLAVGGCASPVTHLQPVAGPASACESDAYIVFVRPTRGGGVIEVREADGALVGRLADQTWFGASVAPGEHFFVAQSDRGEGRSVALKAQLAAGAVYYVDVELVSRFAVLYAVAPRQPYWKELDGWLAGGQRVASDLGREPGVPENWAAVYSYALRWWGTLDDTRISERKLILSDGITEKTPLVTLDPASCTVRAPKPNPPPAVVAVAFADPKKDKDVVRCKTEKATGSNLRTRVCKSDRQAAEESEDAWRFMNLPRALPTPTPGG